MALPQTVQDLGPEFELKLEELLLDPVHGRGWDPKPYQIRPEVLTGRAKPGEKFMQPSPQGVHTIEQVLLTEAETTEWRIVERHIGYSSVLSTEEVYWGPQPEAPVWVMSLYGSFAPLHFGKVADPKSLLADMRYTPITDMVMERAYELITQACWPIFARRRAGDKRFYPRGVERFSYPNWTYGASWSGDHRRFVGSEHVWLKGRIVWEAHFHGGIVNTI